MADAAYVAACDYGLAAAAAANPFVLAAAAVSGLAAGIVTMIAAEDSATESTENLTTAAQNLETAISESEVNFKKTRDELDGTAAVAGRYIDRLRVLEGQERLTADEADEYAYIIETHYLTIMGIIAQRYRNRQGINCISTSLFTINYWLRDLL